MNRRVVLSLIVAFFVSSCGFHLRGNYPLPEFLLQAYVYSDDVEFQQMISDSLTSQDAVIVSQSEATGSIIIESFEREKNVFTRDNSGEASAYKYVYRVEYNIFNGAGEPQFDDTKTATQQRVLNYDPNQELVFEEEEEFLIEDMEEELVLQIRRAISTLN